MKPCRICQFPDVIQVGHYRPYKEFSFTVYDCRECGSRFVWRQESIFETLHSQEQSPYAFHKDIAERVKQWFDQGNTAGLYGYLTRLPKNKFVIDAIAALGKTPQKILEIGCSLGYLTAYHILCGHEVLGLDIATTAIAEANQRFGPHFQVIEGDDFSSLGTFDIVYHLGTIGCVDDPLGFTKNIFAALKPGGKLFFNAPNAAAPRGMKAAWISGTPPPDLITTFAESFWSRRFSSLAEVAVSYEPYDGAANLAKYLNKLLRRPYIEDCPEMSITQAGLKQPNSGRSLLRKAASRCIGLLGSLDLFPRQPLEYGMFVSLTKR